MGANGSEAERRAVVDGQKPRWRPVSFARGPILCNILIDELDISIEHTLRMFAEDTKLSGVVAMSQGSDVIQRDLENLAT